MNILVVDDKESVQHTLTELLSLHGYKVDTAHNGLDALSKVQNGNYQLFVIDHLMPLMNGVQLTKNLKSHPELADIKIIFMTTQGINSVKALPEFNLFDKVIDKPINKVGFIDLVVELTQPQLICEPML